MTKLRDALDNPVAAAEVAAKNAADREAERTRIRGKMSEADRAFIDALLKQFPGARLVGVRFKDGEIIGRP